MATRWSFESLGRTLRLPPGVAAAPSAHHQAFSGSAQPGWLALGILIAGAAAAALLVLRATTGRAARAGAWR
jgi:hypothetical protein